MTVIEHKVPAVAMVNNAHFASSETSGQWLEMTLGAGQGIRDDDESLRVIQPFLLDVLRCDHLLVLSGLGTSLGIPGAPTMGDLWRGCEAMGASFGEICELVGNAPGEKDIERLLSLCRGMLEYGKVSEARRRKLVAFTAKAERFIVEQTSFVSPTTRLDIHEAFLRKIGRRSVRQARRVSGILCKRLPG